MILTKSNRNHFNPAFEIDQKIKTQKMNELLIIVPTNRKSRYLKKEIISSSPGKTTTKINLETLGTYSTKILFNDSEIKGTILSEAAATVLLSQSFREIDSAYFANYKKEIPFGTLERIKNVISEYKKHGITPDILRDECSQLSGSEKMKAADIADIYEKYQQKCEELSVKEIGDVYYQFNQLGESIVGDRFRKFYPDVNLVIIQGFDEFTSPEIEILNSTAEIDGLELFLSFDYSAGNNSLFSHLERCYGKLINKKFKAIKDSSEPERNHFQKILREKLFNYNIDGEKYNFPGQLFKIKGNSREKEIELIAKEIKSIIINDKVEPNMVCVVFNLIQKNSQTIRDIFSLYGIPINLTDRYSLNQSPAVIAVINLLEILENDYYYKNILRAFSGGYLESAGINQTNLQRVSVELKIISGFQNWKNSIEDALSQFEVDEDEDFSRLSFEEDNYSKALSDIEKLSEFLSPFDRNMTLKEFFDNLSDLVYSLNIPVKLVEGGGMVEENVKAVTVFLETISELLELFKLEHGEKEKFTLNFFLNHIRTAVNSSRYNIKERQGYGVQITTLSEIRGLKFDYLFISGLCDGDFPTRYTPEIFFSPSYIRGEQKHQAEERYHFYQSLCAWQKVLYLSVPLYDEKKELVESNFFAEFASLFEIIEKTEDDYKDKIYSKEELLVAIGRDDIEKFENDNIFIQNGIDREKIQESIDINKIRINKPFGESEFSGFIRPRLSPAAKEALEEYRTKQYSISQMETYAKCPYKYFVERVLKLKPVEEPTEEIEALEMGTLLHNILFEFYSNLKIKEIELQDCSGKDFAYAEKLIFRIAEKKIDEARFYSPLSFFEKEKVLGINGDRKNSILYKFLVAEKENENGFTPQYFETSFGKISSEGKFNNPAISNFKVGEVNVRGKIDRIDVNESKSQFSVVDYKLSGKTPSANDLLQGISLQLPLYMFAAKKLINTQLDVDFDPASAEIYSLKFSEKYFGKKKVRASDSRKKKTEDEIVDENNQLIKICTEAIEKYVNSIVAGKFNLTKLKDRDNKVCNYCNFKTICRIEEVN